MSTLTWTRNRTSSPRASTWHTSPGVSGTYRAEKIGSSYIARFFGDDVEIEHFIGAYATLKEAKREAGYHHGRKSFNAALDRSSTKLWREEVNA